MKPDLSPQDEAGGLELARERAGVFYPRCPAIPFEDLHAAARYGWLKARQSYRPDKGARFRTWATRVIQYAMIEELRRWEWGSVSRRRRAPAGYDPIAEGTPRSLDALLAEQGDSRIFSSTADPEREALNRLELRDVARAIAQLPPHHADVIRRVYWDGQTFQAIADGRGVTLSAIWQQHRLALAALREILTA